MSLPFMASGKIVKNYELLRIYVDEMKNRGLDPASSYPTNEDLEYTVRIVREAESINLEQLQKLLMERFKPRIDRDSAVNACKKFYGFDLEASTAIEEIARILAGWTIEIALNLGLVKARNIDLLR